MLNIPVASPERRFQAQNPDLARPSCDLRLYTRVGFGGHDWDMTSTNLESTAVEERAALFSALGDPIRLQILDQLAPGQQCVCEMQEAIDIASNLLSYHLRVLKEAGLVEARRRGRWIDYQLSEQAAQLVQGSLPSGVR